MKLQQLLIDAELAKEDYNYLSSTEGVKQEEVFEAYEIWIDIESQVTKTIEDIRNNQSQYYKAALILFDVIADDE